jgi:DNA end-binding protein Ku
MARPIWKGHVSFGLVNVPVVLFSAEQRSDIHFHLVDSRNTARIRYERVNEETGEEVPWDNIVKGFEYEQGNYVLLSDEELETASVEMTRTIEIEQFVDLSQIDIRFFDRPYVLVPDKKGEKGYVLLREAIADSGKAGISTVVIRSRQYLAALMVSGDALLLELLRFSQELRDLSDFDLPGHNLRQLKVTKKEIELASKLIDGMTTKWNPKQHHDEYRDVLMTLIEKKIKSGKTEAIEVEEVEEEPAEVQTINFMEVLKKSVASAKGKTTKRTTTKRKTVRKKKTPARKTATKKRKTG